MSTERSRGGVAAATAFYGNRAAGAASAGMKYRRKERRGTISVESNESWAPLRATNSALDLEAGFKSPRSVALWKQRKLEMAGIVTVVKRWDHTVRPGMRTVTTPAPIQTRDFSKINPYAVQQFEQWHDRHKHLDYPREIPDSMFYEKRGRGPLPRKDDKGVPTARAYGARHVKKLPGLIPPKNSKRGGTGNAYSLAKSLPQPRCKTAFLNALFQDVGAGDGSWLHANPRALQWLPFELLRAEQFYHITSTLTNLHFLSKKMHECGVAAVRWDLQRAEKTFKSLFHSGRSFQQGTAMETLLEWQGRIKAYRQFIDDNITQLAALPSTIFRLGLASTVGGPVHQDVQSAVLQAEHAISVVHTLLDPLQSSDADAVNNIPHLLNARLSLEVVRKHGVWLAMDSTALQRITTAEDRADEHIQRVRERLEEVPEAIDRVGQVLLRGPSSQSEHWEKDSSFANLAKLFGEDFFGYEPLLAYACFTVAEVSEGADQDQHHSLLLQQLAEETGLDKEFLDLSVDGDQAVLKITAPTTEDQNAFQGAPARGVAHHIMQEACDPDSDLRRAGLVVGGPRPREFWQEACIYITGTVADMQPERDMLSRFVLPALKLECRRRRLRLSWLMCGSDAPVSLHMNLKWVKQSTIALPSGKQVPFSLAILGSKLGWIPGDDVRVETVRRDPACAWLLEPPFRNWSLNQLEICEAQLRTKDARGFIFLRDSSFVNSEAFRQSALEVQDIFEETSHEARDLDEEFKTHVSNHNHLTNQKEACIFEYKTVFVDGEVQDGTGPGVKVAFSGLFSFGLDVYSSIYKMIDSVHPRFLSHMPPNSVETEKETTREIQLQLHASSVVAGTRAVFISQICDLVFESHDEILVAVNGPTGSGRTGIMANICLRARQLLAEGKADFVFAWVLREPWQTEFDWLHCIASQVCKVASDTAPSEYVGETSLESITNALWDMMKNGVSVLLVVDGLNFQEQFGIGHIFNTLQGRSNAEWFGNLEKKAALGRLKVIVSTHGFNSEMHRRVQIIDVPQLELEERLRICWSFTLESRSQISTKVFEKLCSTKIGAAYPRYLVVAMRLLTAYQQVFPGQLDLIMKEMSPHLDTLYENDVLPFLEDQSDAEAMKETLSALVNSKGLLPCEIKWVLQEAGKPGDDGKVAHLVDSIQPYISTHQRADKLLCLGCTTLQQCIARRYNLEIQEVPLHHSPGKSAKAETAAKNRLVHRRLLVEMESKAGFKPKEKEKTEGKVLQKDSKVRANEHELAPACIARDEARDEVLEAAAQGIVSHALWDAGMDCYSELVVSNARSASLL